MIAVDTNVLIYAHRRDSPFHARARAVVAELATSTAPWAIPWPCLHEFYAISTHRSVYRPPSTIGEALTQIENWCSSPSLQVLSEPPGYRGVWTGLLRDGGVTGPKAHDGHVAALCLAHGVSELLTLDRDFARFPDLRTRSLLA